MFGSMKNNECRRLRDRVEELESERRDESERRLVEHERQRHEREQQAKEELHQARDWPEAFRKQKVLVGPELRMAARELAKVEAEGGSGDDPEGRARDLQFWREDVAGLRADLEAIDAAEAIYAEEAAKAREEMKAVRRRMLAAVADRLRQRGESSRGFLTDLLKRLESDDPEGWLDW